jgi:5-methylcytosine-specific restriction endonuclease McrA
MLSFTRFLNPWAYQRQLREERLSALRERDGDTCRRCRRPIRFDLPMGHDQGARIEQIRPGTGGEKTLDNLCLTHGRCNSKAGDHTGEIRERLRPKREAELFSKARRKRSEAA